VAAATNAPAVPSSHSGAKSAPAGHPASTAKGKPVETAKTAAAPPPPPPAPAPDCENPFYVDANGMKRPKPACFGH
jgi:hypothetical protein